MSVLYELEERVHAQLATVKGQIATVDQTTHPTARQDGLNTLSSSIETCKTVIKEWEREARTDGMSATDLRMRKAGMVEELNALLAIKKGMTHVDARKSELLTGATSTSSGDQHARNQESMSMNELMQHGRERMNATEQSAQRSKRVVQETVQVGTETAARLHAQTEQMHRVVEDLDHIHFSMRKAGRLVSDLTRQMATDRCIMFFLGLVALGTLAIIIMKFVTPKTGGPTLPGEEDRG